MFTRSPSRNGVIGRRDCNLSTLVRLIGVALLIPIVSGCDPAGPVEATNNANELAPAVAAGKLGQTSASIQVPGPPSALRDLDGQEFDPSRFRASPRHIPHAIWLRKVKQSTSWDAAVGHAAMAAQSIAGLPMGAQRKWLPRLSHAVDDASDLASLVDRLPEPTLDDIRDLLGDRFAEAGTLCWVNFNNHDILDALPDQASHTFLLDPYWRQDCASAGQVRVMPITTIWNHVHLMYEDPDIGCIDLDTGSIGRMVDGECEGPLDDYADEYRILTTMDGQEIIRIRVHEPITGNPIPFNVSSFGNVGDEAVRFRYKTEGGDWFEWPSLAGNTHWGVSVFGAVEVIINNAGTSLDCGGLDQEAGAPGQCPVDYDVFSVDDFVLGI